LAAEAEGVHGQLYKSCLWKAQVCFQRFVVYTLKRKIMLAKEGGTMKITRSFVAVAMLLAALASASSKETELQEVLRKCKIAFGKPVAGKTNAFQLDKDSSSFRVQVFATVEGWVTAIRIRQLDCPDMEYREECKEGWRRPNLEDDLARFLKATDKAKALGSVVQRGFFVSTIEAEHVRLDLYQHAVIETFASNGARYQVGDNDIDLFDGIDVYYFQRISGRIEHKRMYDYSELWREPDDEPVEPGNTLYPQKWSVVTVNGNSYLVSRDEDAALVTGQPGTFQGAGPLLTPSRQLHD
jgi:hypothetical protein